MMVLPIALAYAGVLRCEFVVLDDTSHVTENAVVTAGLTWDGISKAFTESHASLWVPLTTVSLMADVTLFGLSAKAMHAENVAWHCAATVLLFLALSRMTGSIWRPAVVAMLFGLHPINVESVAWVTERKNVLCAFFTFASLLCWAHYVVKMRVAAWLGALFLFACALLAKPMAVPLPFALLLLDAWPLRRWGAVPWQRLILEKAPLFALSIFVSQMALWATQTRDSAETYEVLGFAARFTNAITSIGHYLLDLLWPARFAVIYPHPISASWLPAICVGLGLLAITCAAWFFRRSHPWFIVGWLIFCGMLVPSLGFVQVGSQARADRFTYLAQTGIWVALVWTVASLRPRHFPRAFSIAVIGILLALGVLTSRQVAVWRNSVTLFQHSLAITGPHPWILDLLALSYSKQGNDKTAIGYWLKSLSLKSDNVNNWANVAAAADRMGDFARTREAYRRALLVEPGNTGLLFGLASVSERSLRIDDARKAYREIVRLNPKHTPAHINLAGILEKDGDHAGALKHLQTAFELNPRNESVAASIERLKAPKPAP